MLTLIMEYGTCVQFEKNSRKNYKERCGTHTCMDDLESVVYHAKSCIFFNLYGIHTLQEDMVSSFCFWSLADSYQLSFVTHRTNDPRSSSLSSHLFLFFFLLQTLCPLLGFVLSFFFLSPKTLWHPDGSDRGVMC